MYLHKHSRIPLVLSVLFLLTACGSPADNGDAGTDQTTAVAFTLQCDMTAGYVPLADPLSYPASGAADTTVIALHGKNGSPTRSLASLPASLNAQGFDVLMPYMPWHDTQWDGTLCEGMSYIDSLVAAEKAGGKRVILLGHSLGGPVVLAYAALENTTRADAVVVLAPGHFVGNSSFLAEKHKSSIELAQSMIAAGNGDAITTLQTWNGGLVNLSTTPKIYLSFHDPAQFPNIKGSIPRVQEPTLWLAGSSDNLTDVARLLGIIDAIPANAAFVYREISGDHFSMVNSSPAELVPWYQGLN